MKNRLQIGNVEILSLVDATARARCSALFPSLDGAAWEPFRHLLADDGEHFDVTISSFLVRSSGKTVLVDTGIGAKDRQYFPNGRLPDALAEAGVRPDEIDIVMATHIHIDHVGWHTTADGDAFRPTFPNAAYVFSRAEWEFFTSPQEVERKDRDYVRDSVVPLEGVADVKLVEAEHQLTNDLTLVPAPGHTPAHSAVAIVSGGEAGVIIGDVCHHPAQAIETNWSPIFDMNPALAAQSREALMRRIEAERMLVLAGHFAHPGFGRLVTVGGKRTWRALA